MDVASLLLAHPGIRSVELTGSRARGDAHELSDWDFAIETDEFENVAAALPEVVAPLDPLAQQWDPLGDRPTYMLMLRGPTKVDLIFTDETQEPAQPWTPSRETLPQIDTHFWDWILWIEQKRRRDGDRAVRTLLERLHAHLLAPIGVAGAPVTVEGAVDAYREARSRLEREYGVVVPRDLGDEVAKTLPATQAQGADVPSRP